MRLKSVASPGTPQGGLELGYHMPFMVTAHFDDVMLSANAETAKDAFAKAIEWHVAQRLADVSISDGTRSFTIAEFAFAMASLDIAKTDYAATKPTPKGLE